MDTRLEWMSRSVPIGAKRMPPSDKESPDELSMKEDDELSMKEDLWVRWC